MAENKSLLSATTNPPPKKDDDFPTFLDSNWSWSDPSSYPLSIVYLPVGVALVAIALAVCIPHILGRPLDKLNPFQDRSCTGTFNYTFQIARAKHHAEELATHDWEIGTAGEAILELISPSKAVFAAKPFPGGKVPSGLFKMDEGLVYVQQAVRIATGEGSRPLSPNNFSAADPASLGVAAVMIGQIWAGWVQAAEAQKEFLMHEAPRFGNGAISHRLEMEELWSDAVFMFPPFLAYYGVQTGDVGLVKEAVRQCELYRDVLMIREGARKGLWRHIVGPSEMADDGPWSTGNGWAAYGMLRVRATVTGWERSREVMKAETAELEKYVVEIIEGAIKTDDDGSGLLRNYLGDKSWFGETSGTALLTAAAYRLGMLMAQAERDRVLNWADRKRRAVVAHVDIDGIAKPAVNPLKHDQREPLDGASPEGESFLLLMGSAWRDCVCAGVCSPDP